MNEREFSDRYAAETRLAGQVESEWRDVLLGEFLEASIPAARRLGFTEYLAGPAYHRNAAEWVSSALAGYAQPRTAADIGGGLGRFLFELLKQLPALDTVTYVEPSPTLFGWAKDMLTPGSTVARVPFLKGVAEVGWHEPPPSVRLDTELLHKIRLVHWAADTPTLRGAQFDLVAALNVLDQCGYPSVVAERIMELVAPRGFVALSCTHQFQQRFFIDPATLFASLHELFSATKWTLIAKTELPFVFRTGERHRNAFMSHHVLYRRVA